MITMDQAKEMVAAGKAAQELQILVDLELQKLIDQGWPMDLNYPIAQPRVGPSALNVARAVQRMYRQHGWCVELREPHKDNVWLMFTMPTPAKRGGPEDR
jgi:hypothetical protein